MTEITAAEAKKLSNEATRWDASSPYATRIMNGIYATVKDQAKEGHTSAIYDATEAAPAPYVLSNSSVISRILRDGGFEDVAVQSNRSAVIISLRW